MASATSLQISDSNAKLREVQLLASLLSVSSLYTTEQTKNGCGLLANLKQELPHSHSSKRRYRNQKEVNISDRSADTQLMEVFLIASRNDKEGGGGGVWHSTEEKQRRKTCHVRRSHRPRLPRSCRPGRRHPQRTLEGSKVGACGSSKRVISLFRKQSN